MWSLVISILSLYATLKKTVGGEVVGGDFLLSHNSNNHIFGINPKLINVICGAVGAP